MQSMYLKLSPEPTVRVQTNYSRFQKEPRIVHLHTPEDRAVLATQAKGFVIFNLIYCLADIQSLNDCYKLSFPKKTH
jgi:hypothetical protein